MAESKAELERKVAELQRALREKTSFEDSAARAELGGTYTMVPIRNYGNTSVSISYEYKGMTKVLTLETQDPKRIGAIPLEVWTELERTNKLVSEGYIARTDIPCTNPNVIEDDEAFIRSHGEAEFVKKLSEMTNHHVLLRLLRTVETTKNKSGKYLSAESALRQRIFEVTETFAIRKNDKTGLDEKVSLGTGIRVVEEEE